MRRNNHLILLVFLTCSLLAQVKIFNSKSKKELNLESFVDQLSTSQVIFFGEKHGVRLIHELEHAILPGLWEHDNSLILSFEMWERDHQEVVNAFLNNDISLDELTTQSRVWVNFEDYLPMLYFAKEKA